MAVTAAELEIVYGRMFQRAFLQANIGVGLCNRRHESQVQNNRTLKIPVSDTVVASEAYTHGSAWTTTRGGPDINYVDFTPNVARQIGEDIPLNVARELPVDMVADTAAKAARRKADDIDNAIFTAMISGAIAGNTSGKGTSTNFIPDTGIEATSAARPFVFDAMWDVWLAAATANVATPAAEAGATLTMVMPPYLFRQLQGFLRRDGNSDAIATRSINEGGGYTFLGLFNIRLTNNTSIHTSVVSSKDQGVIIAFTQDATTFAEKPNVIQTINPNDNQAGPYWTINHLYEYGVLVENTTPLYRVNIRQET